MSDSSRRILISCVVVTIVICLCLSLVGITGGIGILLSRKGALPFTLPTQNASSQPTASLTEADIEKQMDEIQVQVSELRGLPSKGPVARALLSNDQLRQHVIDDFFSNHSVEDAQNVVKFSAAFGLLQPDFDLYHFLIELYSEQIAAFYNYETKEMYIVQGESFLGPERLNYAHEYIHALQDQNYDIQNGLNYNDEKCELESERCAAILSLLEGDASLGELTWFQNYATDQDRKEIIAKYSEYTSPVYDSAPDFIKMDFLFPYQQGLEFVQALYDQGGWDAVDRAYQTLPASTEQIMHPEKYPDDQPVSVTLPDLTKLLGPTWTEVDRGVLGEWYTFLVLAHGRDSQSRLDDRTARDAAQGWGGDAYAVYSNTESEQTVLALKATWDSAKDAEEFTDAFTSYASKRFGTPETRSNGSTTWQSSDGFTGLYYQGTQIIWIYAPTSTIAQSVYSQLQMP